MTPEEAREELAKIGRSATALAQRTQTQGATERDLAIAAELDQAYVDLLDELLETDDLLGE